MKKVLVIFAMIFAIFVSAASAASAMYVTYTPLGVPDMNSSFKSYMDYRCITDVSSPQYKYIQAWGWSDDNGFMRAKGETDLGVPDDYYMVAMGSRYGIGIGTKYRIRTNTGNVFYAVLCDQKSDYDTDETHTFGRNNDIVEFIVDTRQLNRDVKVMGSANVYMPLNGKIASIERMTFVAEE